tara:strand:- start:160 stop:399 length:240 start_codon:yes stop_codon:yes gene_type:complete
MIKYRIKRDVQSPVFMVDDIQKDKGLMKIIDNFNIQMYFNNNGGGGLFMEVAEKHLGEMEDIMEEFMTRDFVLGWRGKV